MGTNYYWYERGPCACCGRAFEAHHIGKSSGGWCFSLYVGEWEGPKDFKGWKDRINSAGSIIKDEFGGIVTPDEMIDIIINRSAISGHKWTKEQYQRSIAEPGPNGLARHKIGDFCIGHGEGTCDYIVGDFS